MFAVFDIYMGRDFEKAVKKMEKRIGEKAPGLRRIATGLSIKVQGVKGPSRKMNCQNAKNSEKHSYPT